jgi:hypothetical protein
MDETRRGARLARRRAERSGNAPMRVYYRGNDINQMQQGDAAFQPLFEDYERFVNGGFLDPDYPIKLPREKYRKVPKEYRRHGWKKLKATLDASGNYLEAYRLDPKYMRRHQGDNVSANSSLGASSRDGRANTSGGPNAPGNVITTPQGRRGLRTRLQARQAQVQANAAAAAAAATQSSNSNASASGSGNASGSGGTPQPPPSPAPAPAPAPVGRGRAQGRGQGRRGRK